MRKSSFNQTAILASLLFALTQPATIASDSANQIPEGAASFDNTAKVLTIPLISNGETNFFNVKIRLDQFTVVDPGKSSQCWLSPPPDGVPESSCFASYEASLAALAGTWRGSASNNNTNITLTFEGSKLNGNLDVYYKFTDTTFTTSTDGSSVPNTSYKKYTQCNFTATEMDKIPLRSVFRYKYTELHCKEGTIQLASGQPLPGLEDISTILLIYAYGGKDHINQISTPFIDGANNGEYKQIYLTKASSSK